MITIAGSFLLRYHVKPSEVYSVNSENLINDSSFENFNQTAGDCCNVDKNKSRVFAIKSVDSIEGKYSLNLTSENQCACINKKVLNLEYSSNYLYSIYLKGDNPRICFWIPEINGCGNGSKSFEYNNTWQNYKLIISFPNQTKAVYIHFYADSSGSPVTNLYDDLQVHRLDPISYEEMLELESINSDFAKNAPELADNNTYVIKTKQDNLVLNPGAEKLNEQGYYLVSGKPEITLHFPWTEVVILVIIMLIVIRLLFKKQAHELENEISHELRRDLDRAVKLYR